MSDSMRPYHRTLEGPELIAAYNKAQRENAEHKKVRREVAEEMKAHMRTLHLQAVPVWMTEQTVDYFCAKLLEGIGEET